MPPICHAVNCEFLLKMNKLSKYVMLLLKPDEFTLKKAKCKPENSQIPHNGSKNFF